MTDIAVNSEDDELYNEMMGTVTRKERIENTKANNSATG